MIKEAIVKAVAKQNLTFEESQTVIDEIMSGQASQIQMSAFLTAMSVKKETIEEITGAAAGMRKHCVKLLNDMDILEIVGTGGDKSNSFNISTTSAFVVSAAGIPVAKHGNRAASSKCGAADVLEALGAKITISPEKSKEILDKINFCFLFAQNYHIAMKYVAPVRKELGIRTIFNILGPLVNPAGASMQLLGVYDEDLIEPMAKVLSNLGVKSAMVVYGTDGLDEISASSLTKVCEVINGNYKTYEIEPELFGMKKCKKEDLLGGTPKENAQITRDILSGAQGAKTDAVILNSAAAIHIAKPEISIKQAIDIAKDIIESKKALNQLESYIKLSNEE
ncbi:MAG: anthranilate phosphoribosyltransferase [Elusimicrobia bacterium]|jgi:anthranilate phosphoribosyltransferase|nr:anthranilate phosphoribosyltransferase [Elusimicrobiota bacterium]